MKSLPRFQCTGKLYSSLGLCIILVFSFHFVSAQTVIRLTPSPDQGRNANAYRTYFSTYAIGTMVKADVASLLQSKPHHDTLVVEADGESYTFSLEANDVRTDNYVLRVQTGNGIETMPRSPNKTYMGITVPEGLPVCITADENFFTAMIMTGDGALYIESAKLSNASAGDQEFVIFNERNVIRNPQHSMCGVKAPATEEQHTNDTTGNRSMMTCTIMETGIANDHLMVQKYGSAASVETQNLAVINVVNANYNNEFALEVWHKVSEIFVSTTSGPWYTGTDYDLLLESFTDWAPNGFTQPHDVGSLWTNRDLNDGVIGLAWVQVICEDAYNILQDFSPVMSLLKELQSHELGHNYGYEHDPEPNYIMSPSISGNNVWSPPSISDLNYHFLNDGFCMGLCPPASLGRVGVGTNAPHTSAILDITSTTKGLLIPRMTPVQRNAIYQPAEGLTVFDTHTKSFWYYNGSLWTEILDDREIQKEATNITLGSPGNVGIGVTGPENKLDIATSPRGNLGTGAHPTNLPVYITGSPVPSIGLEVRVPNAQSGVGLKADYTTGEVYSTGFINDVNLKFSSKGLGHIYFNTNAQDRMILNNTGALGIGTTTPDPSALLEVSSTTKGVLISRMTTAQRTAISIPATGLLVFDITTNSFWYKGASAWVELTDNLDQEVFRNGPDKVYLGLTDSVGIGTTNPEFKFHVKTNSNQYGFAHSDSAIKLASWIGSGGEIGTLTNHPFRLYANDGFEQFELLPNGNIGIGLLNATNQFDIAAEAPRTGTHPTGLAMYVTGNISPAASGFEIRHTNGTQGIGLGYNTIYATGSQATQDLNIASRGTGNLYFATNSLNRMMISGNGNVGIGTTTPHAQLQLATSVANRKIILYEAGDDDHQFHGFGINNDGALRYQTSHSLNDHVFYAAINNTSSLELMRIKGNGNVSITGVVEVQNFIAPTLLNSFTNHGSGHANAGYYKDKMGRVHLRGTVSNINNPTGLVVFTLPAGYRPSASGKLVFTTISNNTIGRVDILSNGDVQVILGTVGWVSLDGISFKAD